MGAVTSEIRAQVVRRSGGRCEDTSGTPHCGPVEASHRNHLRDDSMREVLGLPKYNSAEACECLCLRHHLFAHEEGFGINGLSAPDNKGAVNLLRNRLKKYIEEHKDEDSIEHHCDVQW